MNKFIVAILIFIFVSRATLAEAPYALELWHTDDTARIHFYCTPVFGDDNQPSEYEIDCDTTTTFFNRQEDFADFESLWAKNITQDSEYLDVFDSEGKLTQNGIVFRNQTCTPETVDWFRLTLDQPAKKLKLSDQQKEIIATKRAKMHPKQINDLKTLAQNMLTFCDNPSVSSFKEIYRHEFDKATRTCSINNQSLKERYSKVNDNLWINQKEAGISDPCKRISISSLKRPEGGASYDWQFEFRQVVIDKEAEYLGISCAEIEENGTDLYTNRYGDGPLFLGCDYFD